MIVHAKTIPEEFKKQVTAICLADTSLVTVSKKYHISLNTLYRWRKEHQQAEDQSTTKDYSTLCRQHERQGHILQIIASFKRGEAYRRDYSSEVDFRKSVDGYIRFYNEQRPHQTLAYKSPVRFEELYGQKKTQAREKTCV